MKINLNHWRYPSSAYPRDLRLDLLRGYFIFVMIVDHLQTFPAWTMSLTGGNALWVSAAEGFVLTSGIVFGLLYRQRVVDKGWRWSIRHVGQRAIRLYVLGVIGQIVLSSGDYVLRLAHGRSSSLPMNYLELLESAVFQIRYTFSGLDLLPLYALLLPCGLAAVYWLQRGKWRWVLAGSIVLWYAARLDPAAFVIFRLPFPLAIWQILFIIGVIGGYHRDRIRAWWTERPVPWLTSALLIGSAALALIISYQINVNGLWPDVTWLKSNSPVFERTLLAPGRVVVALWVFAALYALTTSVWALLNRWCGWLLVPLGQHALIAYVVQAFLVYGVTRAPGHPFPDHDPILMGFLHLAAVLVVWFTTLLIVRAQRTIKLRRRSIVPVTGE